MQLSHLVKVNLTNLEGVDVLLHDKKWVIFEKRSTTINMEHAS